MSRADEPAFPDYFKSDDVVLTFGPDGGLTKRELFAAMAMGHLLTVDDGTNLTNHKDLLKAVSLAAVAAADALLAELSKERTP